MAYRMRDTIPFPTKFAAEELCSYAVMVAVLMFCSGALFPFSFQDAHSTTPVANIQGTQL
jgi:hypothetical protein